MKLKCIPLAALALLATACTVGPDYQRPDAPLPAAFKHADGWVQVQPAAALTDARWWTRYADPTLAALMPRIDAANQTLAQFEARWRQAETLIASARAGGLPTLGAQTSATRSGIASSSTVGKRLSVLALILLTMYLR